MCWILLLSLARGADEAPTPAAAEPAPVIQQDPAPPPPADPPFAPPASLRPGVGLAVRDGDPWSVVDASGRTYTTVQFARLVDDRLTLRGMADREDLSRVATAGLASGGAILFIAAIAVVSTDADAPDVLDYSVEPEDYSSEEAYEQARDFQRDQFEKAFDGWRAQQIGTAAFLLGTGALVAGIAPFAGKDGLERENRPDRAYTRDAAQGWIDQYNAAYPPAALTVTPVVSLGAVGLRGSF